MSWEDLLADGTDEPHIVQLYDDERFLREAVTTWAATALERGGAVILLATPAHDAILASRLAARGFEPEELGARLQRLDAHATLARFMDGPAPDAARFHRALAPALRAAKAAGRGEVRAWGEMVDVLRKAGRAPAAMRVEELWNEAIARHGLRLLCSYEGHSLDAATFRALPDIAHGHGLLIPVADTPRLDEAVARAAFDVCGEDAAALLAAMARRPPPVDMPRSVSLLLALHRRLPYFGERVRARARQHYGAPRADAAGCARARTT